MAKKQQLSQVRLPAKDYSLASDYSKILAWYQDTTDSVRLSPREEKTRDRMDFCDNLIRKYGARSQVIPMLIRKFSEPGHEMSRKTAYQIYNMTELAFGSSSRASKDYWRDVLTDMAGELREQALLKGDLRTAAECLNIMGKFRRLDKEDPAEEEKLQLPQTVIIQFQRHSLGLQSISEDEAKLILEEVLKPKRKQDYAPNNIEEVEYVEERATRPGGDS